LNAQLGVARDDVQQQSVLIENVELSVGGVYLSEHLMAIGVNRPDKHRADEIRRESGGLQRLRDTPLDGFGRFIGERKCDETFRRLTFGQQPSYSVSKRSRLPRAGAGQTKEITGPIACGISLRIGQLRPQDILYAHHRSLTIKPWLNRYAALRNALA
jgi:hypothetical protein